MSPAEKEDLARRQNSFARLAPAERQQLRELDRQLASDERSEQLRRIMHRYYRWVVTLEPYERSELMALPPAERARRVKELLDEQTRKTAKRANPGMPPVGERTRRWLGELGALPAADHRLSEEDLKALQRWFGQHLLRHESMIVDALPEPQRQAVRKLLATEDYQRRRSILGTAWLREQLQRPPGLPFLGEKELAGLSEQLTPELRAWLTDLPMSERRRVVLVWMEVAAFYRVFQNPEPSLPLVDEQELARYFEEKLEPGERDRMLILPAQEMQRELLLSYVRSRLAEDRPRPTGRSSSKQSSSPEKRPAERGR
jgi:hypothetical protein